MLNVISPELIDRMAQRLYADDQASLSAYERLMQNDKQKKMDYLNNIRPDLIPVAPTNEPVVEPARQDVMPVHNSGDHYSIDDIPKSEPTKDNITDMVKRESNRRQNSLMEAKREREEAARA